MKCIVIENYEYDQVFDVDDKYEDVGKQNSDDDYNCEEDDGDRQTLLVTSGGLSVAGRQRS